MAYHGHPISNSFIITFIIIIVIIIITTITTLLLVGKITTGLVKVAFSFWILGKGSKSYEKW